MPAPNSLATKHTLSALQRQYIDSRIEEELSGCVDSLREQVEDHRIALLNDAAEISCLQAQIQKLTNRLNDDDKNIMTKAKLIEFMKRMNWYGD